MTLPAPSFCEEGKQLTGLAAIVFTSRFSRAPEDGVCLAHRTALYHHPQLFPRHPQNSSVVSLSPSSSLIFFDMERGSSMSS